MAKHFTLQDAQAQLNSYTSNYTLLQKAKKGKKSSFLYVPNSIQFECAYGDLVSGLRRNNTFIPQTLKKKLATVGVVVLSPKAVPQAEAQARIDKYTDDIKIVEYRGFKSRDTTVRVVSTGELHKYCLGDLVVALQGDPNFRPHPTAEETIARREATMLERHGVTQPFYDPAFVDKAQTTIKERFGPEGLGNEEITERRKETCLAKYGVPHSSQDPTVRAKIEATCLDKYGNKSWLGSETAKKKISETLAKKNVINPRQLTAIRVNGRLLSEIAKEKDMLTDSVRIIYHTLGEEAVLNLSPSYSSLEVKVQSLLPDNITVVHNRKLEGCSYRPDFFLPDHKLIIECDGLYWHSDLGSKEANNYHEKKKEAYTKLGYTSLFFRSDEVMNSPEIVKSMINHRLGLSTKLMARKCKIVPIEKSFFEDNHLMGAGSGPCFGLDYEGDIVAGIQYRWKNKTKKVLDISRFCTKKGVSVTGGFGKLLKQAIKDREPEFVQNFIDLRYGTGKHLASFGFKFSASYLSFRWTNGLTSCHRMRFPGSTGYRFDLGKIWDCGQAKFLLKVK